MMNMGSVFELVKRINKKVDEIFSCESHYENKEQYHIELETVSKFYDRISMLPLNELTHIKLIEIEKEYNEYVKTIHFAVCS